MCSFCHWELVQLIDRVVLFVFWSYFLLHWEPTTLVNLEFSTHSKILDLNVKVKTDESKNLPIMTVKCEDEVLKCDKCEVRLPR